LHAVYSGGHVTSLSSVALSGTTDTMLASGDWGGGICIWKTPSYTSNLGEIELSEKKRKRASEHDNVEPAISFKAHSNNVSGIVWGHNQSSNSNTIITSSWDHSIKSWDVETRNVLLTLNGSKVVTCIDRCHNSDVVATGQPDCTIRLWDMRTDKVSSNIGSVTDNSLKPSHKAWVSAIKWSPMNPFTLASTSHDGTIKLWDIRSTLPLHTIQKHSKGSKAFCVAHTADTIYSGGSDCIVRRYRC